jgi:NADH:ubiquinone oxidoreductase subunit 6 (subunit J)
MTRSVPVDVAFFALAAFSVVSAWLVFRVDSMVRAAFWLLGSFVGVGLILVLLRAEFLGLVLVLMMAGEMTIMAVFMVMFMMNPAGLNPMTMVHQHKTAITAGLVSFLGLGSVGVLVRFPRRPAVQTAQATAQLGNELMNDSMLIFETAGVLLLATMISGIALAARRGRFGDAWSTAEPPGMDVNGQPPPEDRPDADNDEMAGMRDMGPGTESMPGMEGMPTMQGMDDMGEADAGGEGS